MIIWGGLLTTVFFTLFVVPATLLRFEPKRAPDARTAKAPLHALKVRMRHELHTFAGARGPR